MIRGERNKNMAKNGRMKGLAEGDVGVEVTRSGQALNDRPSASFSDEFRAVDGELRGREYTKGWIVETRREGFEVSRYMFK